MSIIPKRIYESDVIAIIKILTERRGKTDWLIQKLMWEINLKNKDNPPSSTPRFMIKLSCFSLCRVGVVESEEANGGTRNNSR